jgi:hypothetical protein
VTRSVLPEAMLFEWRRSIRRMMTPSLPLSSPGLSWDSSIVLGLPLDRGVAVPELDDQGPDLLDGLGVRLLGREEREDDEAKGGACHVLSGS